jgi:AraC family transcriptional regulator, regulatory protein of adaptative response / methylphosphotriester-DNA alkyltransferase methyltransferase
MNRPATIDRRTALLREAVAIVQTEYARDLELRDVARRVSTSPRQLQRAYAEIGGTTFRTHLTDVRMRRAAELLRSTSASVHDIARRVGYRQAAQFAKAFRSRHGVAPSAFRRRAIGGAAR